jgi:uncharacterized protein
MRDFRDAKAMAQTLREELKARSVSMTYSGSLEVVTKILGFHDWNVLSAYIQSEHRRSTADLHDRVTTAVIRLPGGTGLPTVPLRDLVLFPRMIVPLFVGRDTTKRAVVHNSGGRVLVITQRRAADDNPLPNGLYNVGVVAHIINRDPIADADGNIRLVVKGVERMTVLRFAEGQFIEAEVAPIKETRGQDAEAFSLMRSVLEKFQVYRNTSLWSGSTLSPGTAPLIAQLPQIREPGVLADALAPLLSVEIDQKQDLLETGDVVKRLKKIFALMRTDQQSV